jgi:hypothetical protein
MGARVDQYGPGAALQTIAVLGAILTVIFGGVWIHFRARGGYRAVLISDSRVPTRTRRGDRVIAGSGCAIA